jgi:hypothetical protein
MEFLALEEFVVGFGVAFTTLLALIGVTAGIALAGAAEEERTGVRLLWAEWPLPEKAVVAREVKLRLAA